MHQVEKSEPIATEWIESMAIDGGKIRIRTPEGEPSVWRDYKAVNLDIGLWTRLKQKKDRY